MLSFARSTTYAAGATAADGRALPLWWFLLPSLDVGTIQVVGADTPATVGMNRLPVTRQTRPSPADLRDVTYVTAAAPEPLLGDGSTTVVEGAIEPDTLGGRTGLWIPPPARNATTATGLGDRTRRTAQRLRRRRMGASAGATIGSIATRVSPTTPDRAAAWTIVAGPGTDLRDVPAWVREVADRAGHDLTGRQWWVVPPRGYRQQKVLFVTMPSGGEGLPVAVKVTQAPDLNPRLENEYTALQQVWDRELVPRASLPRPLFTGHHAGLAVIGQEAVTGYPFTDGCDATIGHPRAQQVVDWITELGTNSAHPHSGERTAAALADLAERFDRAYGDRDLTAVLVDDAEQVAAFDELPAVFGHGDAGYWNTVVRPDGTVTMCDWENAEATSPPLWDVVYFVQTYGEWSAWARGIRYTPRVFAGQVLDPDSRWSRWLWSTVASHAVRIGLPAELVWPLVRASWAFLALKEATRLAPASRGRGKRLGLLQAAVTSGHARRLRTT